MELSPNEYNSWIITTSTVYYWNDYFKKNDFAALDYYAPINQEEYGVANEGLVCPDSNSRVEIPITNPTIDADLDELPKIIDPMRDSDCCGVDIYLEVITYLKN